MILLADSGSTKTDWAALHPAGTTITFTFRTGGLNPYYLDAADVAAELRQVVFPQTGADVTAVHFYGAGCSPGDKCNAVETGIREVFPTAAITVNSDLLGAARGLCGRQPGLIGILGTGANSGLYDGEIIAAQRPSLGFWLGDEGSGGYLGKTLVQHYLLDELPPEIRESMATAYPHLDRAAVLAQVYDQPFPNRWFAAFAPFLRENLEFSYVYGLVYDAFSLFLKKYLLRYPDAEELPFHATGSVAYHFNDILKRACGDKGLSLAETAESPLPGLIRFHGSVA